MTETWFNSPQSPNRFRGCDLKAIPGQSLMITIEMHDGALGARSFFTMADHTGLHFSRLGLEI